MHEDDFPPGLGQPALRALRGAGYTRLEQLAAVTESDLGELHGMGPKALGILRAALQARGLAFAASDRVTNRSAAKSIDEYIAGFPAEIQKVLQEVRAVIKAAAETISYAIPTFDLNGHLVHFAGFKQHVGFYPAPSGIAAFEEELKGYKRAKGSVQFPLGKPMPTDLIRRIVEFRVRENTAK